MLGNTTPTCPQTLEYLRGALLLAEKINPVIMSLAAKSVQPVSTLHKKLLYRSFSAGFCG